ncbi:MAG: hypothetical protein GXP33_08190 [Spirochaetes bacterium]|nr:hypothetical protein [Spirochaetota bacterium]
MSRKQINRLVEIIQQYAVIYGGGISTKDARVREECEELIDVLESMPVQTETKAIPVKKTEKQEKSKRKEKAVKKPDSPIGSFKGKRGSKTKTSAKSPVIISEKLSGKTASKAAAKPGGKKARRKMQAIHLFDAYSHAKLPKYGGYIVSSNFQPELAYSIFEIVGYDNVQEIRLETDSLIFKSAGCKLYTLIEPANYPLKNVEPVQRESGRSIPYRFSELYILTTKKHETVYIGKKPIISYSSFTIIKPKKNDFAILFYNVPEVFKNMEEFLTSIYHDGVGITRSDSAKAAKITVQGIKNFNTWLDL